jgi:hypothetical protein
MTYDASDSTGESQKPKEALCTSVSTMGGSSESTTENDEQGSGDKGNLATGSVANQANEDLPDDGAW